MPPSPYLSRSICQREGFCPITWGLGSNPPKDLKLRNSMRSPEEEWAAAWSTSAPKRMGMHRVSPGCRDNSAKTQKKTLRENRPEQIFKLSPSVGPLLGQRGAASCCGRCGRRNPDSGRSTWASPTRGDVPQLARNPVKGQETWGYPSFTHGDQRHRPVPLPQKIHFSFLIPSLKRNDILCSLSLLGCWETTLLAAITFI